MSSFVIFILLSSIMSLTSAALSPTLEKSYFFVNSNNNLSQELYQTHNGIVAHSIEYFDNTSISRYTLLDITSKDAHPILADVVNACEIAAPVFQHVHYHAETDSLVYFCPKNTSLLIIDQSNYTVQNSISSSLNGSWPTYRLSNDGQNVAILGLDTLFNDTPKSSMLMKVDMQTKNVTTEILFDQSLSSGEAVVAFASSKKGTYVATNIFKYNETLFTTIYSLVTIGNSYQLTLVSNFAFHTYATHKVITKLFCLENYVAANNGGELYFINQKGSISKRVQIQLKPIGSHYDDFLFLPSMTSQNDGNYLYALINLKTAYKYSVDTGLIFTTTIGDYSDIQVAFGNQTSGDLILALDYWQINFSIIDVNTLKTIYSAISGYDDLILTNTTYTVIKSGAYDIFHVYILDLKNDTLIQHFLIDKNYYTNKDQYIISFLNSSLTPGCWLSHIDLITGNNWDTLNFTGDANPICSSWVYNLRITEKGNPEVVFPLADDYLIISETYGKVIFPSNSSVIINLDALNVNFDTLSVYHLIANPKNNNPEVTLYNYDPQSNNWNVNNSCHFYNIPIHNKGFFALNASMTVSLSNSTFTLFNQFHAFISYTSNDWNLASSFQDSDENLYVLLTYANPSSPKGSLPKLYQFSNDVGKWINLPDLRLTTVRAQAAGPGSYWLHDDVSSTLGTIRFYNATKSNASVEKTLISI